MSRLSCCSNAHLWRWRVLAYIVFVRSQCFGLNTDGLLLLSFKNSILSDPYGILRGWDYHDTTPCSWAGISCGTPGSADAYQRVTGLSLPDSGLLGPIPATLGMIEHLRNLNLSNNSINGSIPSSLFSASELQVLDFSNNWISGGLPELVGRMKSLRVLNLSDNALSGELPENLTALQNLTAVSLKNNYFFGSLPVEFTSVRYLDLSSNLINGTLPTNFSGQSLSYVNVSFNRLSGGIPPGFARNIAANATVDLSFNNLTGPIPLSGIFLNQTAAAYSGNPELCGKPLKNLCPIPSSIATLPEASSAPESSPAIAAIPKIDSSPVTASPDSATAGNPPQANRSGLRTGTILGIVVGDVAGVGILVFVFVYVYHAKRRKSIDKAIKKEVESSRDFDWGSSASPSDEYSWLRKWTCIKKHRHGADGGDDHSTSDSTASDSEGLENPRKQQHEAGQERKTGALVTVDGEKELELETLLKASAYILGASGSSIMYKAVLEDGTTLAVRRVGENGVERFRDFENQVRVITKLVHPNLVRIRGFYWGTDEKLIIYDFIPNGSLANARYRKAGSSPCHLPWELRLKIARGVARGLCYIHEKKHVHGNLKPSNILLGPDMDPKIGDFGLERLVAGENSSSKTRNFGSKRSTASRDSFQDYATTGATPSPSPSVIGVSPYHAPESLRSIKPNPKWDVFSFGVVLLELLTGKVISSDETGPALAIGASTSAEEDKGKVLRMADTAIRVEVEGKEEPLLGLLKLGYACISPLPQKRPSMKEILQALDKFPTSASYAGSSYYGQL